ncbi:F-box/LRR-repeat protein [Trifolium pratense]|uniref:F-box/LRR-repeat protein n=1 Tax=Trifolium pratense TaxID=57577 RepID=A0A2K3MNA0_TRIPR|nr:F-box/LRR-repeat protein [Trifolium pratense]PNY17035.1 F-box/LRR-repeat protein [Trifolium pratense]
MEFGLAGSGVRTPREKPLKKHKVNECEDITNKLPEPLISRILSLLPTKDAARTSVLSKKWMYRWISVSKLDLDDSLFYNPKKKTGGVQHFRNFVNRALLLTKGSSLESFSLAMTNKCDISLLNTWISSVLIPQKIKNLRIHSKCEWSVSPLASRSLFNSIFLEELVLQMFCCDIEVPTKDVYFGSLKFVKLHEIIFFNGSSIDYLSLILPVLEKFEIRNCDWLFGKGVIVKAPLLESVCIEQDVMPSRDELRSCEIKFSDCHLKEFTFNGYAISQPVVMSDPLIAQNARANITLSEYEDGTPEARLRAFVLLNQFSHAKSIKFDGSEVLPQPNVAALPEFPMLGHLELGLIRFEVLFGLLQRSPILKTLTFKGIFKFDLELLNSTPVPDCFASTLQVVKFARVCGFENELCLAKFFMENGKVLERMSFSLASLALGKSKIMEDFKEKLFSFKKGFSFAIVEFSYD